jgi:peptidoglycan/LPS O-acetylase OafA/YrhL
MAVTKHFGRDNLMQDIKTLTGLRGVAAYSVLLAHSISVSFMYRSPDGKVFAPLRDLSVQFAYFGMSLFFILSGFVIYLNYSDRFLRGPLGQALRAFFVGRFARLYPLYLFSILLGMAYWPAPIFVEHPTAAFAYLTMTQSWFNMQQAAFAPGWSISTEWFFYFAFVPLVFLIGRLRRPWLVLLLLLALVPPLFLYAGTFQAELISFVTATFSTTPGISAEPSFWLWYVAPPIILAEFLAGALAAACYLRNPGLLSDRACGIVQAACGAGSLALLAIGGMSAKPFGVLTENFIYTPLLAPLILATAMSEKPLLSRVLASKPLHMAGTISYSVYILQMWILTAMGSSFNSTDPGALAYFNTVVRIGFIFALTTFTAFGGYHLIEEPSRRWIRRFMDSKAPKAANSSQFDAAPLMVRFPPR